MNTPPTNYEEINAVKETVRVPIGSNLDVRRPFAPFMNPSHMLGNASELEKQYFLRNIKGRKKSGRYEFQGKLISGGMGTILRVRDRELQRPAAMKVLLPTLKNDELRLRHFLTEAKITGMLEHPNIMPVHEIGLLKDVGLYFTMKLAKGEPLIFIIEKLRQKKPDYIKKYQHYDLLKIFRKVCDAVSFAHSVNIIHRDIKPNNIMVGQHGEVLVMEWGLAKYIGKPDQASILMTREFIEELLEYSKSPENIIKGSPSYMAPEQIKGNPKLLDKRTDIFLLGATLYHMFTLEPPYYGKDVYEILFKAERRRLVSPDKRNPKSQIPKEISHIILKAMAFDPEDRYQTVEELSEDIDDLMAGKWKHQEKKFYQKGEWLLVEGQIGDEAYLILKGSVEVFKERNGSKIVLDCLKAGDIVGEMALISQEKRSASVIALEYTEVAVLTRHLLTQNLDNVPPYIKKIVRSVTDRLHKANENIHPYANMDCTYIVLRQLMLIFKSFKGNAFFRLPFDKVVRRIALDLGIPILKVRETLINVIRLKLITHEANHITIPDIEEVAEFADLARTLSDEDKE